METFRAIVYTVGGFLFARIILALSGMVDGIISDLENVTYS